MSRVVASSVLSGRFDGRGNLKDWWTPADAHAFEERAHHAPGRYRVNGVLSNIPEFQKAFSCRADAPMVRQHACRVW